MRQVTDFGVSKELVNTLAKAKTFLGTFLYMAPERIDTLMAGPWGRC